MKQAHKNTLMLILILIIIIIIIIIIVITIIVYCRLFLGHPVLSGFFSLRGTGVTAPPWKMKENVKNERNWPLFHPRWCRPWLSNGLHSADQSLCQRCKDQGLKKVKRGRVAYSIIPQSTFRRVARWRRTIQGGQRSNLPSIKHPVQSMKLDRDKEETRWCTRCFPTGLPHAE